jgi:hypothetical protein
MIRMKVQIVSHRHIKDSVSFKSIFIPLKSAKKSNKLYSSVHISAEDFPLILSFTISPNFINLAVIWV